MTFLSLLSLTLGLGCLTSGPYERKKTCPETYARFLKG